MKRNKTEQNKTKQNNKAKRVHCELQQWLKQRRILLQSKLLVRLLDCFSILFFTLLLFCIITISFCYLLFSFLFVPLLENKIPRLCFMKGVGTRLPFELPDLNLT